MPADNDRCEQSQFIPREIKTSEHKSKAPSLLNVTKTNIFVEHFETLPIICLNLYDDKTYINYLKRIWYLALRTFSQISQYNLIKNKHTANLSKTKYNKIKDIVNNMIVAIVAFYQFFGISVK